MSEEVAGRYWEFCSWKSSAHLGNVALLLRNTSLNTTVDQFLWKWQVIRLLTIRYKPLWRKTAWNYRYLLACRTAERQVQTWQKRTVRIKLTYSARGCIINCMRHVMRLICGGMGSREIRAKTQELFQINAYVCQLFRRVWIVWKNAY